MTNEQATQPRAKADIETSTKEKLAPKKAIKTEKPKLKIVKTRRRGRKPYPIIPFEQALRIGRHRRLRCGSSDEANYSPRKTHVARKPDNKGSYYGLGQVRPYRRCP